MPKGPSLSEGPEGALLVTLWAKGQRATDCEANGCPFGPLRSFSSSPAKRDAKPKTKWDEARRPLSCYAPLWGRMQSKWDVIYCFVRGVANTRRQRAEG